MHFFSIGAILYYQDTFMVISYFEFSTDYENDIFKVISNLQIKLEIWGSKSGNSKQTMLWDFLNVHK